MTDASGSTPLSDSEYPQCQHGLGHPLLDCYENQEQRNRCTRQTKDLC